MKTALDMPSDLDYQAKKKWEELVFSVDPNTDAELLGNYCRQHSSLLAIRREKKKQQKSGKFRTMVKGRDGTMALHPLITAENRMVASLNRMLQALGLVPSRDAVAVKRLSAAQKDAKGMDSLEAILCGLKAWNPQTRDFEDVPEGHPDHPGSPDFKRQVGRVN
jgi:phage terminase small subunit